MVIESQAIQLESTAKQLENIEAIDLEIQNFVTYLQDGYEQFNYKYLKNGEQYSRSNTD